METIVLLHAGGTTSRMWRLNTDALAVDHQVLTPDLPGHGGTPGPFTFDRAVAAVSEVIAGVPGPVHLCGISLSVTVAVLTCLAVPDRLRGLVLSGGHAKAPPALAVQRAISAALPEGVLARGQGRLLTRALAGAPPALREETVAGMVADFRAIGKHTYLECLRELARTDLRSRLAQVRVPALVLCGDRDRVNLPGSRQLADGIPGARLRLIPGAGHLWNLERPDAFNAVVAEFVGEVTG